MSQIYSTEQTASSRRVLDELLTLVSGAVLIGTSNMRGVLGS